MMIYRVDSQEIVFEDMMSSFIDSQEILCEDRQVGDVQMMLVGTQHEGDGGAGGGRDQGYD